MKNEHTDAKHFSVNDTQGFVLMTRMFLKILLTHMLFK